MLKGGFYEVAFNTPRLVSTCMRNQVSWDGERRTGNLATGTARLLWVIGVGVQLAFTMSPMFLTRAAKPPMVSVPIGAKFAAEEVDGLPFAQPSGFSTAVCFSGSNAIEFIGIENETRSALSY